MTETSRLSEGLNVDREDQSYWQHHIVGFDQSGLSRKKYCQQHQVNYDRFQYWYRKLKNQTPLNPASNFIPITVKPSGSSSVVATIVLRDGHHALIHDTAVLFDVIDRMTS